MTLRRQRFHDADMGKKDPRVDAYIKNAALFAKPILKYLRKAVHTGCPEVEETIKWSMPHFDYNGIMCGMAAFKKHCAFGFWKSKLILLPNGNTSKDAMGQFGRVRSLDDLPPEKTLIAYVRKAAELNDSGAKVPGRNKPKKRPPFKTPPDLLKALGKNASAGKTFEDLSASGKREYVEWIVSAKREETRKRRLDTAIEWLSEGKKHNWRYIK
ncbi:MAG: YdeI/OmpD-associated family protein [Chthoniobacterales bacterium]